MHGLAREATRHHAAPSAPGFSNQDLVSGIMASWGMMCVSMSVDMVVANL